MSTKEFVYSEEDITTLYHALQAYSPHQLVAGILGGRTAVSLGEKLRSTSSALAVRRASSMLQALFRLSPNCEASATVILPWKASHLSQLSQMSWPDALGSRIVMPSGASAKAKAALLANVLLNMSYV